MYSHSRRLAVMWSICFVAGLSVAGCTHPPTSRSGAVHDIRIAEGPEPADLIVNPGDEVRWVNMRTLPVRVDLVNVKHEDTSCERGFSNMVGTVQESATIKANDSASICFTKAGVVNYNLRMESALPGGEAISSGVVRVGNMAK
jgi:plastocyanin